MRRMVAALAALLMAVTGVVALVASSAAAEPVIPKILKISEFRFSANFGSNDEFIEVANVSDEDHTVQAFDEDGYGLVTSDGVLRCWIPNGTVIPAGGHWLCTSVGYSLNSHPSGSGTTAVGDMSYLGDIPVDSGVALFMGTSSSMRNEFLRLDAVGFTTSPALYREGDGIPAIGSPFASEYSLSRVLTTAGMTGSEVTSATPGLAQDTDDNAADFIFADTGGAPSAAGTRLGTPNPQNLSSPIAHGGVTIDPIDPCVFVDAAPNTAYSSEHAGGVGGIGKAGTLSFRRAITNTTDAPITRLRLRIADMTVTSAPAGHADLRALTSTHAPVVADVHQPGCDVVDTDVPITATTVEAPPIAFLGGGVGSAWSVGSVSPTTPLEPGASIWVEMRLAADAHGTAGLTVVPEVTTDAAWQPPAPVCLGSAQVGDSSQAGANPCGLPAPIVTLDPEDQSVAVGETATFTVAGAGHEGVNWQYSTDGVEWDRLEVPNLLTLSIPAELEYDGWYFRAVFIGFDEQRTETKPAKLTVSKIESSVELSVEPEAPARGDDVELTAEVSPADATGTVQFQYEGDDYGDPVAIVDGEASITVEDVSAGEKKVRATYSGDDLHQHSDDTAKFEVGKLFSELRLSVDEDEPIWGDTVVATAEIEPDATVTGTVQFTVDGNEVGDPVAVEDGEASVDLIDLGVGERVIKAVYSGDDDHAPSEDDLTVDVAQRPTSVELTSDPEQPLPGEAVTFTAVVDPAAAFGTVQFAIDGVPFGDPVALDHGAATSAPTSDLPAGPNVVTATYAGTKVYAPSDDEITVTVGKISTTTEITAVRPEQPVAGDDVELDVTVSPAGATGHLQPTLDGDAVGSAVAVVDGQATVTLPGVPAGEVVLGVAYSGDATHEESDDDTTVTVGKVATTTTIDAVWPAEPVEGDTVELDVTVTPVGATGEIFLYAGDSAVDEAVVDPQTGKVTLSVADVPKGEWVLDVSFDGDDTYEESFDTTTIHVVTDNAAFVRRAFLTVLGRSADAGGLEYWTGVLDAGGSRERLTDTLARSTEGRRKLVVDAYAAVLNRAADVAGRDYWVGRLAAGLTPEDLVVQFAASPEAKAGAGGTTEGLVGMLYKAHLGRSGDPAGVEYWAARIDAATTENARRAVAKSFGRTSEVTTAAVRFATRAACAPGTEVPTDAAYASSFASTGRDHLRLAGLVLARHCPQPVVD